MGIYQNCNVFHDGALDAIRGKAGRYSRLRLERGEPLRFGAGEERGVIRDDDGHLELVDVADVGEDVLVVHDAYR